MSSLAFDLAFEFYRDTCITCGITFAYPSAYNTQLRRSHQQYHCPNGHTQYFSGESDAEKAKRLQQQLSAEIERRSFAQRQLAEEQERGRKLRRRIKNGVCPAGCKRSFANLRDHMKTQHPGYAKGKA